MKTPWSFSLRNKRDSSALSVIGAFLFIMVGYKGEEVFGAHSIMITIILAISALLFLIGSLFTIVNSKRPNSTLAQRYTSEPIEYDIDFSSLTRVARPAKSWLVKVFIGIVIIGLFITGVICIALSVASFKSPSNPGSLNSTLLALGMICSILPILLPVILLTARPDSLSDNEKLAHFAQSNGLLFTTDRQQMAQVAIHHLSNAQKDTHSKPSLVGIPVADRMRPGFLLSGKQHENEYYLASTYDSAYPRTAFGLIIIPINREQSARYDTLYELVNASPLISYCYCTETAFVCVISDGLPIDSLSFKHYYDIINHATSNVPTSSAA